MAENIPEIQQKMPLTSFFWCLYALISLWELRYYITNSSFAALGQLLVIMITFFCLVYNRKFKIYRTKDDFIIVFFILFIVLNCIIQSMFQPDVNLKLVQLRSLLVLLLIISPYFISRSVKLGAHKETFIYCLFIGASLLILYKMFTFFQMFLIAGDSNAGRVTVGARYPVIMNFVFLMALLIKTRSRIMKYFAFCVALSSFFLIVVSLTRAGYICLVVDLVILFFMRPKKIFIFIVVTTLLLSVLILKYSEKISWLKQVTNRVQVMVAAFKNPATDSSASDRIATWKIIGDITLSDPVRFLFGSGELGIAYSGKTAKGVDKRFNILTAESQYFDTLIRSGVIGLILTLMVSIRMITVSFLLKNHKKYGWFYTAMFIGYVAMLQYNMFAESFRFMNFGLFFYAVYGFVVSERCATL